MKTAKAPRGRAGYLVALETTRWVRVRRPSVALPALRWTPPVPSTAIRLVTPLRLHNFHDPLQLPGRLRTPTRLPTDSRLPQLSSTPDCTQTDFTRPSPPLSSLTFSVPFYPPPAPRPSFRGTRAGVGHSNRDRLGLVVVSQPSILFTRSEGNWGGS